MRQVRLRREGSGPAGRRQVSKEQDGGEGEPQERQGDPRHVDQGLLDRDESESPEQDEEQQRGVDGPIARESFLGRRHIRESFTFDKKLRASIAGGAVEPASSAFTGRGARRRSRSQHIHAWQVGRLGLEEIRSFLRTTEPLTQFFLTSLEHLWVV